MLFEKKIFVLTATLLLTVFISSPPKITILHDQASVRLEVVSHDILGSLEISKTNVEFDPKNLKESSIEIILESASLNTGKLIRDIRLCSRKFLQKKKYPVITFKSKEIKEIYGRYLVKGALTIKDITKEVIFDVGYREGSVVGAGSVNLMDFDMKLSDKRYENKLDVYINFPLADAR